jgi:hypothetical protein
MEKQLSLSNHHSFAQLRVCLSTQREYNSTIAVSFEIHYIKQQQNANILIFLQKRMKNSFSLRKKEFVFSFVDWIWLGKFKENGILHVLPPDLNSSWTQGPQFVEILPRLYVGNFIAACKVSELNSFLSPPLHLHSSHNVFIRYSQEEECNR